MSSGVLAHEALAPSGDLRLRSQRSVAAARRWILSDQVQQLLALFDGEPEADPSFDWLGVDRPPRWVAAVANGRGPSADARPEMRDALDLLRQTLEIERRAAWLFDARGRAGRYFERAQATATEVGADREHTVWQLVHSLGMVESSMPAERAYDGVLVLGGAFSAPLHRARYVRHLEEALIGPGDLYFLGSPRSLLEEPDEAAATANWARGACDEFDLVSAAASNALDLVLRGETYLCGCLDSEATCPRSVATDDQTPVAFTHQRARTLEGGGRIAFALSARTGRPPFRPDTSDTLSVWAEHARPSAGYRALIVTSQAFTPFQYFEACRVLYLPLGVIHECVGYGADWSGRPLTISYLLQEVLSSIRSARRLLVAAIEATSQARSQSDGAVEVHGLVRS